MSIKETIARERLKRKSDAITKANEDLWVTNRKSLMAITLEKDLLRFTEKVTSEPIKIDRVLKEVERYRDSLYEILASISAEM